MIKFNLNMLLAKKNIKALKMSQDTNISRVTLSNIANNKTQGIQLDTLNTICNYLGVEPKDLFIYIPFDIEIDNVDYRDNINGTFDLIVKNEYKKYSLNISFKSIVLEKNTDSFNVTFNFYLKDMKFDIESYLLIKEMFENNSEMINIFIENFKNKIDIEIFKRLTSIKKDGSLAYEYSIINLDILRIFNYSRNEIIHNSIVNNILNTLEK